MFAEPSVMAAFLLPRLLHMADKYPACPALAGRLRAWAGETAPRVLEDLAACRALRPGGSGPRGCGGGAGSPPEEHRIVF